MEISEQEYASMQAKITDLQAYKDNHERDEEQQITAYLAQRAATRKENEVKIAATKNLLR